MIVPKAFLYVAFRYHPNRKKNHEGNDPQCASYVNTQLESWLGEENKSIYKVNSALPSTALLQIVENDDSPQRIYLALNFCLHSSHGSSFLGELLIFPSLMSGHSLRQNLGFICKMLTVLFLIVPMKENRKSGYG